MYDIIVVGAGPAGMTAALYALRAGKSVLVIEAEGFGGQITFSPRVENYPGIKAISGNEYADGLLDQIISLGAETEFDRVVKIENKGEIKEVVTESGKFECKSVIIAAGVKHRHLGVANEEELTGAGVSYCAVCDGAFYKEKDVAVVGGGDTALQDAIFLSSYCKKVYLIHRRDEFRGEKRLVEILETKENVEFVLNSQITELKSENNSLTGVTVENKSGEKSELKIDGLFVAVGQIPQNEAFSNVVALDEVGYVASGEDCITKTDGIFTAGDCRRKSVRQLTTAVADGAVAALAACTYIDKL